VKPGREALEELLALPEAEAERIVRALGDAPLLRLAADWPAWSHKGQEEPGGDWRVWVMLAGRGFGKTRAGAEWVSQFAREHPGAAIALVAATADEARRVMIEGRSGLLATARAGERDRMSWEPSLRRLRFASGAEAFVYSGAHPDALRGPEHHLAWCDELAKWGKPGECWTNLQLGLRCGTRPRTLVTTTPRPIAALRSIIGEEGVVKTGGRTSDNPQLAAAFVAAMERQHGGTRLGRQELGGELIEDVEGALWTRALIEASRDGEALGRSFRSVVIGVDPPAGMEGDACGIVACGLGEDGAGYVLGDHSVRGLSPEGWARKVAAAAEAHKAARVVAEANNGGRMVESVLRGAGVELPVRLVHASEGKIARAAPVAALFESGRAKLAGRFPALEDEMAGLTWAGEYHGPGRSPDRADAMVWAMTELMLGRPRAEPRIRLL
jgi:predicted phage terminase large subunit-like protein